MNLRLLMKLRGGRASRFSRTHSPESARVASVLFGLSIAMAVLYLPLLNFGFVRAGIAAKVFSVLLLLAYAERPGIPRALLSALGLSALADLLLALIGVVAITPDILFLCGLGVFLIAQLCYIFLFLRRRETGVLPSSRRFGISLALAIVGVLLWQLWPYLGVMLVPCVAYALVLAAMAVSAQLSKQPQITALGALLFVASDAMLAFARFRQVFPFAAVLVWASYYAAQVCIARGVVRNVNPVPSSQFPVPS